jgi:hypothetical protein
MGYSWIHDRVDFLPEDSLRKKSYPSLKTWVFYDKFALINGRLYRLPLWHHGWNWWTKWSKIIIWKWDRIYAIRVRNWWTWNRPPRWWPGFVVTSPPGGYFGFAGDWDVPAEASGKDKGGYDDTLSLIWLKADTAAFSNYYGAFQFLNGFVVKGGDTTYKSTSPFGAHILNNATQMYPFRGYNDDSLWKYMSTPGYSIEQDSAQDMNIVISAIEMLDPDSTTVIGMEYALLATDQGEDSLRSMAAKIKRAKPGDANLDGKVTVSDVVFLVNYLFKGGPEPWLAYSDANGDEKVTVSDVVYLVNYLFKGGPPAILVWCRWVWWPI